MKKLFISMSVLLALGLVFVWLVGSELIASVNGNTGPAPDGMNPEKVVFNQVHGWYLPVPSPKACVLLMHGIRSNKAHMMGRAQRLMRAGYSSLAIDLQAHGETGGETITFGIRESKNAHDAADFLRQQKHCQKLVVVGSSLGGAAALLGAKPVMADAYIFEAVYPNIERAVRNRIAIRLGEFGALLSPLLYGQIPLRLNIQLAELQPEQAIKNINAPVLIINGSRDARNTLADANALYDSAPQPKQMAIIEGARHSNIFEHNPDQYEKIVLGFLHRFLER